MLLFVKKGEYWMKWEAADIQTFIEAREYVDTALVPLYGVSFAGGMSKVRQE